MREVVDESGRTDSLRDAQAKAARLFEEVVDRGLIRPGRSESQISDDVRTVAAELLGVTQHWHKRIVRSGPNTLLPYAENPPDRQIGADDIVFFDFGPVFAAWEADFGRTYVLGEDPVKLRLRDDLEPVFWEGRRYFEAEPDITGGELYAFVVESAQARGWEYGGPIAGHLIGEFPHERIHGDKITLYIAPENATRMRDLDEQGCERHWILEIHLVDRDRQIGGFFEQLLTI
jgi:Xaa-Pro aminopeptidase